MRRAFIILSALCFVISVDAQNRKVDSLNNLLAKATSDTGRINLLVAKATAYTENNLDSAISIAKSAAQKAKQVNYQKGEAEAYRTTGVAFTYKGVFPSAFTYYTLAERLYKQIADSNGLNKVYSGYGMYYGMQSKYDSSIVYFKKVIEYNETNHKSESLISSYQNIAVSYTMLSNYTQALNYQSHALKLAEEAKDNSNLAYINLNMGINYSNIDDHVRAEALYRKAVQYAQLAQIKNVELYAYANLATGCNTLGRHKESYDFAMKAAGLGKQLGDYAIVASSLARAAEGLAYLKEYNQAEQLATEAIAIGDTAGSPMNIFQTNTSMGFIKKLQQQYPQATSYYEKGFAALKDADLYDKQISSAYNNLSEVYENQQLYEKALSAFKTATKISDSIRSRENIRKATELSMNYDFSKKEQALNAEQDKRNAIARARQLALLLVLGFTLLLITGAVIAYRNKQNSNVLLRHQKDELQKTLGALKTTQNQLVQSEKMASLGELTAGIAHEIQNPLNFVNNFSETNVELIEEAQEELKAGNRVDLFSILNDIKANESKINHHGKRADAIVKGMLQHSRVNTGRKEPTDINALCDEYLRLSYHGLRAKDKTFNADFKTDFDAGIGKVELVPQDIGRVLLNLFNNAFYAVQQKTKTAGNDYKPMVSVTTKKVADKLKVMVKDNGMGISKSLQDKIFQPFFTTKPTGQGTGLGLSLSYDIVKAHGGELKIESEEGQYTQFIVQLPCAG